MQVIANIADVPVPRNATLPPREKEPILKEALDWLRKSEPKPETVDEPTLQSLASLNGLPTPRNTLPMRSKRSSSRAFRKRGPVQRC